MSDRFTFNKEINVLSLVALVLSILGIVWQVRNAVIGSDIRQQNYENMTVEFRCQYLKKSQCWNGSGANLTIILPAFYSNLGADGYSDAVDRVYLSFRYNGVDYKMYAKDFWYSTQTSSNKSKPVSYTHLTLPTKA